MGDSILDSIKLALGITSDVTAFDTILIMHINSVFGILKQLGVGPAFSISSSLNSWSDYTGTADNLEMIKSYMYAKVKLIFDPPTNSALLEALKEITREFEWRSNVEVDPGEEETT